MSLSDLAKKRENLNVLKHDYATTYPLEIPDLQIKMVYWFFFARLIVRMFLPDRIASFITLPYKQRIYIDHFTFN